MIYCESNLPNKKPAASLKSTYSLFQHFTQQQLQSTNCKTPRKIDFYAPFSTKMRPDYTQDGQQLINYAIKTAKAYCICCHVTAKRQKIAVDRLTLAASMSHLKV